MSILQTVWTDLPALIRLLERDALVLIATAPAEALRLAYFASEMRLGAMSGTSAEPGAVA